MRTLAVIAALCFSTQAVRAGERIAVGEFIEAFKGSYIVDSVNGSKPKPENEMADVSPEPNEGILTFSYCQPTGVCDPGYIFLPFDQTEIVKSSLSPGRELYDISVKQDGTNFRYTWETEGNKVILRNYQYSLQTGELIVLEHVAHKIAD